MENYIKIWMISLSFLGNVSLVDASFRKSLEEKASYQESLGHRQSFARQKMLEIMRARNQEKLGHRRQRSVGDMQDELENLAIYPEGTVDIIPLPTIAEVYELSSADEKKDSDQELLSDSRLVLAHASVMQIMGLSSLRAEAKDFDSSDEDGNDYKSDRSSFIKVTPRDNWIGDMKEQSCQSDHESDDDSIVTIPGLIEERIVHNKPWDIEYALQDLES